MHVQMDPVAVKLKRNDSDPKISSSFLQVLKRQITADLLLPAACCILPEFSQLLRLSKGSWMLARFWFETISPARSGWSDASSFWSSCPACLVPAPRWAKTSLWATEKNIAYACWCRISSPFSHFDLLTWQISGRILWDAASRKATLDHRFIPWGASRGRWLTVFAVLKTWHLSGVWCIFSRWYKTLHFNWSYRNTAVFMFFFFLLLHFWGTFLNDDSLLLERRNECSRLPHTVLDGGALADLPICVFTGRRNESGCCWGNRFDICRTRASRQRGLQETAFKTLCTAPLKTTKPHIMMMKRWTEVQTDWRHMQWHVGQLTVVAQWRWVEVTGCTEKLSCLSTNLECKKQTKKKKSMKGTLVKNKV